MSVRGLAERAGGNFVRVVLTEISLTPLPADQSTLGSVVIVKSFGELARRVVGFDDENLEEDNMADEVITKDVVIELINTGFNERKEEFLETIREELKDEFGVVLGELKERVEKLEAQGEAPVEAEEVVDEEVVVEEEPVEEEVVLDDNDVVEEELYVALHILRKSSQNTFSCLLILLYACSKVFTSVLKSSFSAIAHFWTSSQIYCSNLFLI